MRARLAALLLLGTFGCGEQRAPERAPPTASESSTGDASTSGAASSPPSPVLLDDLFEGIEALRPEPWTGWPLENIDVESPAGWRIDPVSGSFVLEQGLILASDPGAFVLAIAPGEVLELHSNPGDGALELVIDHGDGIESRYGPLSDALVHPGLPVTRGAAIGLARDRRVGLSVMIDGVAIDPLLVLRQPLHRWPALLRDVPKPVEPTAPP